jgi:2-dehydro-3-deoxy-D-arabinonate dehydratase
MVQIAHLGQYWCAGRGEVRLLGAAAGAIDNTGALRGTAFDLSGSVPLPAFRARFRDQYRDRSWESARWTYSSLPMPLVELVELMESSGQRIGDWARDFPAGALTRATELDLEALDREPTAEADHLLAPVIPRRAQAFGVTYLNSALERDTEGQRRDYGYVYRSVKNRGERPEVFLKATAPEHFVGPGGKMGLRRDLTNSEAMDGQPCERVVVAAGIEPELAAVTYSSGEIWGYTLADDVSGNRLENETLLYLYQAKHFTGALVLGPLIWLSSEQSNPGLEITCRIFSAAGKKLFDRTTSSARINAPLSSLIGWAGSHIALLPAEVFSTGTDMVPHGEVKVLQEGMTVEISCPQIGRLRHGAARIPERDELNLDYSRLEFQTGVTHGR